MSPFSCNGFGLLTPSLTGPNSHREVGGAARLGVGERHAPAAAVLLSCCPAVLRSVGSPTQHASARRPPAAACLRPFCPGWPGRPFIHADIFSSFGHCRENEKTRHGRKYLRDLKMIKGLYPEHIQNPQNSRKETAQL